MMTREQSLEILKQHAAQLAEHFDTVQIICTRHDEQDGTATQAWGAGNLFGRFGSVDYWLDHFDDYYPNDNDQDDDD